MPTLVTKKLVLAACAWAACAATSTTPAATAARHRRETIAGSLDIGPSIGFDWLNCRSALTTRDQPAAPCLIPFQFGDKVETSSARKEAPRNQPRRLVLRLQKSGGLLDRRELPACATRPREGPDLGGFGI